MYMHRANKSLTGEVRLSYCHIAQPKTIGQNADPKYSVTILIPKSDTATLADLNASIEAAAAEATAGKTWNGIRPPMIQPIIHDGDGVRQDGTPFGDECKGMWVLTASRRVQDGKPWVCDISNPAVELSPLDIYSGMWARCTVHFFGYATQGKKGIGCGLDGVMKIRDDAPLGGAVKPTAASEFGQFTTQATVRVNPLTGQPM